MGDLFKAFLWLCFLGVTGLLVLQALALLDLYSFEWAPLLELVGYTGILTAVMVDAGLLVLGYTLLGAIRKPGFRISRITRLGLVTWTVMLFLLAERTFMAHPFSARIFFAAPATQEPRQFLNPTQRTDFERFSLAVASRATGRPSDLAVMYARTAMMAPRASDSALIGATIDRYARVQQVDSGVLFFFAYVCSFWGEALPGPMPFFRQMTPETLRDLVQVHLPGWFIESPVRTRLVSSEGLNRLVGDGLAFKIRYALHKATLDVSAQPYDLNLFTDAYVALREFPDMFPELSEKQPEGSLQEAIRTSFHELRPTFLLPPYEQPYRRKASSAEDYGQTRDAMKRFARATYYLLALDFDFATRVAASVVKYQQDYYRSRLGAGRWAALPPWQKASLLGMTRDLYVPNVGHLGPNVYALPELNSIPVDYVARRAIDASDDLLMSDTKTWRPHDYTVLWGGAGTKLRILSEVWNAAYGNTLPGLEPEDTLTDSRAILIRHLGH